MGARLSCQVWLNGRHEYEGRALEPKRHIEGTATIAVVRGDELRVLGCAFAGLVCKEQRWRRLSSSRSEFIQ